VDFFFSGTFWGIILILFGVSIIFGLHIPIFRIIIAMAIIGFGIRLLTGSAFSWGHVPPNLVLFSKGVLNPLLQPNVREFNFIFAEGALDLLPYSQNAGPKPPFELNSVFANTEIRIPKNAAVRLKTNAAFASVEMPDGNKLVFGSNTWLSPALNGNGSNAPGTIPTSQQLIDIEANAVFSRLQVRYYE